MFDYLFQHYWIGWLTLSFLLLVLELGFGDFFLTCIAFGALTAMFSSLFPIPLWVQILIFVLSGTASICLLRPALLKKIHAKADKRSSNAEALIGKEGTVVEAIQKTRHGYVKVDGDEWRAFSENEADIPTGTKVRIVRMDSIVVWVTPLSES